MSRFKSVAKKLGYVVAACVILFAVMVSVSRLLSPMLDDHRQDFEKWASDLLTAPVTIQHIQISWYQYQPVISLNAVTILNKGTKEPVLQIKKVRIFFSIPKSLWQRQLVPSGMMISGTDVNLHQSANKEITIQGFPSLGGFSGQPYQRESKFTDVLGVISTQPHLILRDIDIRYTGFNGQKRFVTLYHLNIQNSGEQHMMHGKAILHQAIPTEFTGTVEWSGQTTELNQIKAKIYLYFSGLSLSQWLNGSSWNGWQINQGLASTKIWATWDKGMFQEIQSNFQLYELKLYSQADKVTHKINRLSGHVGFRREANDQVYAGEDIFIDLPSHLWQGTSFYVVVAPDAKGSWVPKSVKLGYVDLKDIQSFLFSSPAVLSVDLKQILSRLQLQGALQNLSLVFSNSWKDWQHISLESNFRQLSFSPLSPYPGFRNLSGSVKWNGTQGDFSLDSKQVVLRYDTLFNKPVDLGELSGNATWRLNQNHSWALEVASLKLLNNDITANSTGTLTVTKETGPIIDLKTHLDILRANRISRYLPMKIFEPGLTHWLKQAFLAGEIKSITAELHGAWKDFPFDKGNGNFLVTGLVKNMDLQYAEDWPLLQNINGQLTFSGRKMTIDAEGLQILNIPIKNVHAEIADLTSRDQPATVNVKSDVIQTDFTQGLQFVEHSPLKKTLGKMFSGIALSGPMTLKLGLSVPLNDTSKTTVQGDMAINNAEMNLLPWHLKVNNLNGQLHFTENMIQATNIQGQFFNKPLQLSLATVQKTKDLSVVKVTINNHLSISDLQKWLAIPFSKVVNGTTNVNTEIDFSPDQPLEFRVHSDLVGLTIDLPDVYAKKMQEARDFTADIFVEEQSGLRVKLAYGDLLNAALILNRNKEEFNLMGADLHFGKGIASWPQGPGFYITGDIETVDIDKMKQYWESASQTKDSNLAFRGLDVHAKQLNISGQELTDVHLQTNLVKNKWVIDLNSAEVNGKIQVPTNFTRKDVITAQFEHFNLSTPEKGSLASTINIKSLPVISFIANETSYNEIPLGQVSFRTTPSNNGLVISSFRILSSVMSLQARGDFRQTDNGYLTYFQGNATSNRLSDLLSSLGFDVHNFIANRGGIGFNLNWRDAPFAPSLSTLNGHATLNVGSGRVADIGQASDAKMGIGRMLSIFSLQTIPRRLSLDFSDLFQKGYSFDSIRGDLTFENGNAYTSNLRFEGPVARVGINGRIGLKDKDYDFMLSVTPHLTSSVPAAAAYAAYAIQPLVGLAVLAVNTVISPQLSKATTHYYEIKGPWSNPTWNSISGS